MRSKSSSVARHMVTGGIFGGLGGGLTGSQISDGTGVEAEWPWQEDTPDGDYRGEGAAIGVITGGLLGRYTGGLSRALKGSRLDLSNKAKELSTAEGNLVQAERRAGELSDKARNLEGSLSTREKELAEAIRHQEILHQERNLHILRRREQEALIQGLEDDLQVAEDKFRKFKEIPFNKGRGAEQEALAYAEGQRLIRGQERMISHPNEEYFRDSANQAYLERALPGTKYTEIGARPNVAEEIKAYPPDVRAAIERSLSATKKASLNAPAPEEYVKLAYAYGNLMAKTAELSSPDSSAMSGILDHLNRNRLCQGLPRVSLSAN